MNRPPTFTKKAFKNTFNKDYRSLPISIRDDVKEFLKELDKCSKDSTVEIPANRRLKKKKGLTKPEIWQVYLKSQYRLTFHIDHDVLVLRRCTTHREIEKKS